MKPDKPGRAVLIVVLTAIGVYTITADRRHLSPPLAATLLAVSAPAAAIVARASARTLAGWASTAFLVLWAVSQPANAAHLGHNAGVFLATGMAAVRSFSASI